MIGNFFSDHDRRRIGIACGDDWHNGGIHYTKIVYAMNLPVGIHYRHLIFAHFTATAWMICRFSEVANKLIKFFIALIINAWCNLFTAITVEGGLLRNFTSDSNSIAKLLPIALVCHIVKENAWMIVWIE